VDEAHAAIKSYSGGEDAAGVPDPIAFSTLTAKERFYARMCNLSYMSTALRPPSIEVPRWDALGSLDAAYLTDLYILVHNDEHLAIYEPYERPAALGGSNQPYNAALNNLIVFRGSQSVYDAMIDIDMWMQVSGIMFGNTSFSALANTLKGTVETYCTSNPNRNVELLGHSLGGMLAATIYYMGLLPGSNIGAKVISCRTYNIYAVPNYWYNAMWEACRDHAISPTIGNVMRDRVFHYISYNDYAPALVRSRGFGTIKVFEDPAPNVPYSSLLGVAWAVYTESISHKITLFTGATDYPVQLTSYEHTTGLTVGAPIMLASEKSEVISNTVGATDEHHLKVILTDTDTDWKLSSLKGGGDDEDHYEWIPQVLPDEYLIYEEGGNKFWSKKYQLSSDNSTNITNAGGVFTKDVYFRHHGLEPNYVNIISGNKLNVYMIPTGQFKSKTYPCDLATLLNATTTTTGYYDPAAGPTKVIRGQFKMHRGSSLANLLDGQPWGEAAAGHRRLLDISNYVGPVSVGPEIVDGGVYRIWLTKSEFKDTSTTPPTYERRIISVLGSNSVIGYPVGHALGSIQVAMTYDVSNTDSSAIESEWTVNRVNGTADIVLKANSVEMKLSAHPYPDDGGTFADQNIGSNKLYLVASGTTSITATGLSLGVSGANGYYIRGVNPTTSTTYELNSNQNSWSASQLDPLHWDPTLSQCEVFFEPITSSGIP
jgi:hypothetical protein